MNRGSLLATYAMTLVAWSLQCSPKAREPGGSHSSAGSADDAGAPNGAGLGTAESGAAGAGAAEAGAAGVEEPSGPNPIIDGAARFSVLSPTLIRIEYAEDGKFSDAGSFNAQNRQLAQFGFGSALVDGWTEIKTAKATLRYRSGSGRFSSDNLQLVWADGSSPAHGLHVPSELCTLGQLCEAEDALLSGDLRSDRNHAGYTGEGFVDQWSSHNAATWRMTDIPKSASLRVRYANGSGAPVSLGWAATPGDTGTIELPSLKDWDTWGIADVPFPSSGEDFTLALSCPGSTACAINVDALAVTAAGADFPTGYAASAPLGGWKRNLDNASPDLLLDGGFLSRDGWYLLDDGRSALWDQRGLPSARTNDDGHHQDLYLFAYGHDYRAAVSAFAKLTGPAPLLPRYAFGVGFSRYFAYHDTDWEKTIVPAFRDHQTPLDFIGVDTDWKSPNASDGWNWSSKYFPDPGAFAKWASDQQVHVLLNVRPSINESDPRYAAALATAGSLVDSGNPDTKLFDLGKQAQIDAYGALHQPLLDLGMVPWFDSCCESVLNSIPGLDPGAWANQLYAQWPAARGKRGFAWARAGGTASAKQSSSGPWTDHRSTVQCTGDTVGEWWQLAMEAELTASEVSIGMVYVSHDIGSYHAQHPADDLYQRWLQFGVFQPILRLYSDHGDRLPWDFGSGEQADAIKFLKLREAMLPYNYTLAWQAHVTGISMARPLWLDYPDLDEAYENPTEYLWGDSILVAPVTVPSTPVTVSIWFPPGQWLTMAEAGLGPALYKGPGTFPVATRLGDLPVFVKVGSIVPLQSAVANAADVTTALEPRVYGGANADYTLYEDAGEGLGYQNGESATTALSLRGAEFTIAARSGGYPGAPASRAYRIVWSNIAAPRVVKLNGAALSRAASGDDSWSYDLESSTLQVRLSARPVTATLTVTSQ